MERHSLEKSDTHEDTRIKFSPFLPGWFFSDKVTDNLIVNLSFRFIFYVAFLFVVECALENCYHPTGKYCSWYKDCFEAILPCGNDGYALEYALPYCNRYTENYNDFSHKGKIWVDATRHCLQQKLAPFLKKKSYLCEQVKEYAFKSHVDCYVHPYGSDGPSYCNLSLGDKLLVANTIKGAFVDKFLETTKGAIITSWKCLNDDIIFLYKKYIYYYNKIYIYFITRSFRGWEKLTQFFSFFLKGEGSVHSFTSQCLLSTTTTTRRKFLSIKWKSDWAYIFYSFIHL